MQCQKIIMHINRLGFAAGETCYVQEISARHLMHLPLLHHSFQRQLSNSANEPLELDVMKCGSAAASDDVPQANAPHSQVPRQPVQPVQQRSQQSAQPGETLTCQPCYQV